MKDKWYIVALVIGVLICIMVATYSYFNPRELLPASDDVGEVHYVA